LSVCLHPLECFLPDFFLFLFFDLGFICVCVCVCVCVCLCIVLYCKREFAFGKSGGQE
jgi:hypothetical protein